MTAAPSFPAPEAATGLRSKLLDAGQIDHALLSLLVPRTLSLIAHVRRHLLTGASPLQDALRSILPDPAEESGGGMGGEAVVRAVLSALLAGCTLAAASGAATPAMRCLGLRVGEADSGGGRGGPAGLWHPRPAGSDRIAAFVLLSAVLPTLHGLLRVQEEQDGAGEDDGEEEEEEDDDDFEAEGGDAGAMRREARRRRRLLRRQVLRFASYVFPPLRLANHLLFLFSSGRDGPAPPTLALRLAGLAVVADGGAVLSPSSSPINYAYAYRRVLLDQTYRLAQALLPAFRHLAALPRAARAEAAALLARRIRDVRRLAAVLRGGESRCGPAARAAGVTVAACSICKADPVTVPYASSCGCEVACYVCIRGVMLDQPEYRCRSCGRKALFTCVS